jgi:hypothetical protein
MVSPFPSAAGSCQPMREKWMLADASYGKGRIEAKISLKFNTLGAIFRFTFTRFSGII